MDSTLLQYVPMLLTPAGVALQWMRASQNPKVRAAYPYVAVLIAGGIYALTWTWEREWREEVVLGILTSIRYLGEVCGGTFLASKGATAAVNAGFSGDHPMVPVTVKGGS